MRRDELRVASFAVLITAAGGAIALATAGSFAAVATAWDSEWYYRIVDTGYPIGQSIEGSRQFAFYPLWPAVLWLLKLLPLPLTFSVLLLGAALMFLSAVMLYRLIAPTLGASEATLAVLIWSALPPNWIHLAAYSEGIFICIQLAMLHVAQKRSIWLLAALAFAIGVTRPTGALWVLAAIYWILTSTHRWSIRAGAAALALSGAVLWQGVISLAVGSPLAFFAIQSLPGWERGFGVQTVGRIIDSVVVDVSIAWHALQSLPDWGRRLGPEPLRHIVDTVAALHLGGASVAVAAVVVIAATMSAVALMRRRLTIPGVGMTVASIGCLYVLSGQIESMPRYVAASPLIVLGATGYLAERVVARRIALACTIGASLLFAFLNLSKHMTP